MTRSRDLRSYKRLGFNISGPHAGDEVLDRISALENVELLQIANETVSEAGWKHLSGHSRLRELMVVSTAVESADLAHIARIPNLRWFMNNSPHLDDEAVRHLAGADQLRVLTLHEATITDDGLAHFADLTQLRSLELPKSQLTDAGLGHLQNLRKLAVLHVNAQENFTERGVRALADLSELRSVRGIPDELVRDHLPNVARRRILEKLTGDVHAVDFFAMPLREACEELSRGLEIDFAIDDNALQEQVSMRLRGARSRDLLNLLCEINDLAWAIEAGHIRISMEATALDRIASRSYELSILLGDDEQAAKSVADVIPAVIAPESWAKNGGDPRKTVSIHGTRMAVDQSPHIYRQIEALLDEFGERALRPHYAEEIVDRLSQRITLRFQNTPLDEILGNLSRLSEIPLLADEPALARHDIAVSAPVTTILEDVPLSDALNRVLDPLAATWTVRHGVVVVFPQAEVPSMCDGHVYQVGDLLLEGQTAGGIVEQIERDTGILQKPGRHVETAFRRIVVRGIFHDHQAVARLLSQ